ncbi:hypothetical protein L2E82_40092 [Cichorium intybus]|uniref:Uncharacterized protein n=1 Tax=Cichorium intybus TaxID=13427 RepID=A0ACB9AJV7_CICIN|nr:hypothetical protein L2E82_40092 [Cichorium intybus]
MSFGCLRSRFGHVHELIHMIGRNARLFIRVKVQEDATQGKSITALFLASISRKDNVDVAISVSSLVEFLSVSCILPNTGLVSVNTERFVLDGFVFLRTCLKKSVRYMSLRVPPCRHHEVRRLLLPPCRCRFLHHLCCICTTEISRQADEIVV